MAKRAEGVPKTQAIELSKSILLNDLAKVDNDLSSQKRVKAMEDDFRYPPFGYVEKWPPMHQ